MIITRIDTTSSARAALSFLLTTLFIGLPIWWKTTEVYRATIPIDQIDRLNQTIINVTFGVNLFYVESDQKSTIEDIKRHLISTLAINELNDRLIIGFKFFVKQIDANLKEYSKISDFDNDIEIDQNFNFYIFPQILKFNDLMDNGVYLGSSKNCFLHQSESTQSHIEQILTRYYLNFQQIQSLAKKHFTKKMNTRKRKKLTSTDISDSNSKPTLHTEYLVELTLIVPEPNTIGQFSNVGEIITNYFKPVADKLHQLIPVKFESQMLYNVDFNEPPVYNKDKQYFQYNERQLHHLISNLEQYTVSLEVKRRVLRFLIYFTPDAIRSLFILDRQGQIAAGNAFTVLNWGAVTVVNKNDNSTFMDYETLDIVLTQIKNLLGFTQIDEQDKFVKFSSNPLPQWELDRLTFESTLDYSMSAVATLNSLNKLIAEITNIVINDQVAKLVEDASMEALRSISILKKSIITKQTLNDAHRSARMAREKSEKAFFDESLLALLYFPDDQKYAIYVPLFLPVLLPIFMSLKFIVNYLKQAI